MQQSKKILRKQFHEIKNIITMVVMWRCDPPKSARRRLVTQHTLKTLRQYCIVFRLKAIIALMIKIQYDKLLVTTHFLFVYSNFSN